jgi:thioredoxin 1
MPEKPAASSLAEIKGKDDFTEKVLKSDKPVLVDFTATWCMPCRMMGAILEDLAKKRPDISFVKMDVDNNPVDELTHLDISSLPAIALYNHGKVMGFSIGLKDQGEITEWIKQSLAGDKSKANYPSENPGEETSTREAGSSNAAKPPARPRLTR